MNPCPCGWRGHLKRRCLCSESQVQAYQSRVSGPLLDRIDLYVTLSQEPGGLTHGGPTETSAQVALRVHAAWTIQNERQGVLNAYLNDSLLDQRCQLDHQAKELFAKLVEQHGLSARAVQRTRRVARTCADLEGCESISRAHLSEAYRYRGTTSVQ